MNEHGLRQKITTSGEVFTEITCGLGNPPSMFTTNASESINVLLKHKVDYKKHQLPDFIDKVGELVAEQKQEVERAVVNRGKWRFRSQCQFLQVQESVLFTMNAQQRQNHLSRVHSISLAEAEDNSNIKQFDWSTCNSHGTKS